MSKNIEIPTNSKPYYEEAGIRIFHGNCADFLLQLPVFDLCLTDPPYGIGENAYRVKSRTKQGICTDYGDFSWDDQPVDRLLLQNVIGRALESIVWGGNYFWMTPSRGWLVWDKQNSGDFADCELAWTNIKTSVRIFRHMWNGMLRASENHCSRVHPTQKPIALMKWCLSFAPDAKTVIDPFMGSGSVLVAAKHRGMTAVGIDQEERYCEIAAKRLAQGVIDFEGIHT